MCPLRLARVSLGIATADKDLGRSSDAYMGTESRSDRNAACKASGADDLLEDSVPDAGMKTREFISIVIPAFNGG